MTTGYDQNGKRDDAAHGFQAQAEQISRRLGESAQTVWLAGLGALGRVQSEGGKLFDSLVREGAAYERSGQRKAAESVDELREEVETQFEQARDTAVRGWDKLGKAFDERVKGSCARSTSPSRTNWKTCVARWNRSRPRCVPIPPRPSAPIAPPTRQRRPPAATPPAQAQPPAAPPQTMLHLMVNKTVRQCCKAA